MRWNPLSVALFVYIRSFVFNRVHGLVFINCYEDVCNTTYQYCSETYERCHSCKDILSECGTSNLPALCIPTCVEFLTNAKQEEAREKACFSISSIENGEHNMTKIYPLIPGTTVEFRCHAGFRLVGDNRLQCLDYGVWSSKPTQCQALTCDAPQPLANGYWVPDSLVFTVGNVTTAFCVEGYNMEGAFKWQCSPSGWQLSGSSTISLPYCVKREDETIFASWIFKCAVGICLLLSLCYNIYLMVNYVRCCRKTKLKILHDKAQMSTILPTDENELDEDYVSYVSRMSSAGTVNQMGSTPQLGRGPRPTVNRSDPLPFASNGSKSEKISIEETAISIHPEVLSNDGDGLLSRKAGFHKAAGAQPMSAQMNKCCQEDNTIRKIAVNTADITSDDIL